MDKIGPPECAAVFRDLSNWTNIVYGQPVARKWPYVGILRSSSRSRPPELCVSFFHLIKGRIFIGFTGLGHTSRRSSCISPFT